MVFKLRLKPTKQSEVDKARFPCCGIPSNHTHNKRLGGSSVETKEAYQSSQINDLLRRIWGRPYVSSQGYNVVPKSKSVALGASGKSKCQVTQVRELLERFFVR